jgi:hypothetical protein
MTIDGQEYIGIWLGGDLWKVRRFAGKDHESYVEAEIRANTMNERIAIDQAIKQGSWA